MVIFIEAILNRLIVYILVFKYAFFSVKVLTLLTVLNCLDETRFRSNSQIEICKATKKSKAVEKKQSIVSPMTLQGEELRVVIVITCNLSVGLRGSFKC